MWECGWARATVKKVGSFPYITRVIGLGDWNPVLFEMELSSQAGARIKLGDVQCSHKDWVLLEPLQYEIYTLSCVPRELKIYCKLK